MEYGGYEKEEEEKKAMAWEEARAIWEAKVGSANTPPRLVVWKFLKFVTPVFDPRALPVVPPI